MAENRVRIIIEADAKGATAAVKQVDKELDNLSTGAKGAATSVKQVEGELNKAEATAKKAGASAKVGSQGFTDLGKSASTAKTSVRDMGAGMEFATSMLKSMATAFGAFTIAEFARQTIEYGMSLETSTLQMKETFGTAADSMIGKAKELAASLNNYYDLTEIEYAFTKTADSMERYGITGEKYLTLVSRAADVGAAKNLELKESIDRIESAMRGEAEASEYLGVTLNDTYMKNMAFGGSLRDTWEKLDDNEKALYRYKEMMLQTEKYTGAAERATGTLSGALRSLANEIKSDVGPALESLSGILAGIVNEWTAGIKGLKGAIASVNMNHLVGEANEIKAKLNGNFWSNYVFGGISAEDRERLKTRLKEITTQMEVYSERMVAASSTSKEMAARTKQAAEEFDYMSLSAEELAMRQRNYQTATEDGRKALEKAATAQDKIRQKMAEARTMLQMGGITQAEYNSLIATYQTELDKATKKTTAHTAAQKSMSSQLKETKMSWQELNDAYYKALAEAQGMTDPEILYAEGMQAAAKRSEKILEDLADKQVAEQKRADDAATREYTDFINNLNNITADSLYDIFSGGLDDFNDFLDTMKQWFLKFAAQIAATTIVVPITMSLLDSTGLGSLFGLSSSSGTSAAGSAAANKVTGTSGSSYSAGISDIFGLKSLFSGSGGFGTMWAEFGDWLSDFDVGIFEDVGLSITRNNELLGKLTSGLAGAVSTGFGIKNLFEGNYFTGAGQTIGGLTSIASALGLVSASMGPIGVAIAAISSILGPMIDSLFSAEKELELTMGTVQTSKGLLFKLGDSGLDSDTVDPFVNAVSDYLIEWEKAFDVSWTKAINDLGVNWSLHISQDDLENLTSEEIVGKMTNSIMRAYAGQLAKQAFDIDRFNMTFLEGATGTGAFDWDYGELNDTVSEIFGYFQALEDAGVEVGKYFNGLSALLNNDDIATGEFFAALQTSEESLGETMSRVIEGLSVVPDSLQRMDVLMAGIDTGRMETFRDDLEQFFSAESVDWIFGTVVSGLKEGLSSSTIVEQIAAATDMQLGSLAQQTVQLMVEQVAAGMASGLSAEEAYQYLENVYNLATSLFSTPIDEALADAIENEDFDSFKEAFRESLQSTLLSSVTDLFTSDLLEEVIANAFGGSEGLYTLLQDYLSGDIDIGQLTGSLDGVFASITNSLEAVWPTVQKFIDALDQFTTSTDAAGDSLQDYIDYYNTIIDNGSDLSDLSSTMDQLNDWWQEQVDKLLEFAAAGEDVTEMQATLWEAFKAQLAAVYDEIMGDWQDVLDDANLNEYEQRLRDLNESYQETAAKLKVIEEANWDTSIAVAQLTEAYRIQYDAIVNDLLGAIYDASQAMTSWAYDIDSAIADITGAAGDWETVAADASEGFRKAIEAFNEFGDIDYLTDAKNWLEKYYSAMQSEIKARYQTEIDALQTLRDATEAYYDAQIEVLNSQRDTLQTMRDQTEAYYEAEIDARNEIRDQIEATYDAQIESLEKQLDLAEQWADVLDSVRDQILDMLLETTNPADIFERMSIAQGEIDRLTALWQGSSGEERAEYASQLADAIRTYMGLLGDAYQRPSNEYMTQYQAMLDLLEQIQADAEANGADTQTIEEKIAALEAEQAAKLAEIDAQIESLQAAETAALEGIDAQLDGIDSQIEALQDAETAALEGIDNQVAALNTAMEAELSALDKTIVEYYQWLKSLGLETYEATLTDLADTLTSILSQSQVSASYDNYYQNESVAWYRAIHGAAYDTSLGVGYMIGQLDNIYGRLGSVASYDVGTPYVPRTGLAIIHQGEAIIPAGMSNGGSAGASGDMNVTINVDARGATAADAKAIAATIKREVGSLLKSDRTIRKQAGIARI